MGNNFEDRVHAACISHQLPGFIRMGSQNPMRSEARCMQDTLQGELSIELHERMSTGS